MSTMYFAQYADADGICKLIKPKIAALLANSTNGISIDIKKYQRNRTTEQNRYLWAIYKHITEFTAQTGFMPDGLNLKFINSDFLHEYFKARFDVKETKKLSTTKFCTYTDNIQNLMIEQSKGEYDPIYPKQPFQTME